jgi:polyhydroxybutyrate depolymerase
MANDDGAVTDELMIGGRARRFTIRLPRVSDGGPRPLVLVLHGDHPEAGGRMMRERATFDEQADARGWVIAYPDGHGGCWADGRGVTSADEAGVDDVAFLRALTEDAAGRYGTAPDRPSSRTTVGGGVGGTRVAAWTVLGGGHTWPGAPVDPELPEPATDEFDAAEEICRFAAPLPLPAAARRL